MRVTSDIDGNALRMIYYAIKGTILLRRIPHIRRTSKGWHLIWHNIPNITEEESLKYRMMLGDDEKRIALDMLCKKKIKQVLFVEKETIYYNGLPAWWIGGKREIMNICPKCRKRIVRSEKRWKIDEKRIAVFHEDGSICYFPLAEMIELL
jgi:hypothetical protein